MEVILTYKKMGIRAGPQTNFSRVFIEYLYPSHSDEMWEECFLSRQRVRTCHHFPLAEWRDTFPNRTHENDRVHVGLTVLLPSNISHGYDGTHVWMYIISIFGWEVRCSLFTRLRSFWERSVREKPTSNEQLWLPFFVHTDLHKLYVASSRRIFCCFLISGEFSFSYVHVNTSCTRQIVSTLRTRIYDVRIMD